MGAFNKVQGLYPGQQQIVDWCIGRNRVFILDTKPGSYEISAVSEEQSAGEALVTGRFVSSGSITGMVKVLTDAPHFLFEPENIIVSKKSRSSDLILLADTSGFVTDEGSRLCNTGIMARELQIPFLTATHNATSILKDGGRVQLVAQQGKVLSVPQEPVTEISVGSEEPVPMPFGPGMPEGPAEGAAPAEKPVSATRLFARVGPGMLGKIDSVDGFIVSKGPDYSAIMPDSEGADENAPADVPVWVASAGEHDFPDAVSMLERLKDSGSARIGVLIPLTRGPGDMDRLGHRIPAGVRLGLSIKTPAMALSADSVLKEGVSLVNMELKSLVQLTMGLERPDRDIHPAVLRLISGMADKCRDRWAKSCVSVEGDYLTDKNIELLVRSGIDVLCVEPGVIEKVKGVLSRVEKKILIESGAVKEESDTREVKEEEPGPEDDFTPSFSLL